MLSLYSKRDTCRCCNIHFFLQSRYIWIIDYKFLNYLLRSMSDLSQIGLILRSSHRPKLGLGFDSEVTWQYRKVTGQIATVLYDPDIIMYMYMTEHWTGWARKSTCKVREVYISVCINQIRYHDINQNSATMHGAYFGMPNFRMTTRMLCYLLFYCVWLPHFVNYLTHFKFLIISS